MARAATPRKIGEEKMNEKEKKAIGMLKKGESIASVAMKTGFSAFWLSMKMNEAKI